MGALAKMDPDAWNEVGEQGPFELEYGEEYISIYAGN